LIPALLILSPVFLLFFVDVEQGRKEAGRTLRMKSIELSEVDELTEVDDDRKGIIC